MKAPIDPIGHAFGATHATDGLTAVPARVRLDDRLTPPDAETPAR
jgi:hypothetical protein